MKLRYLYIAALPLVMSLCVSSCTEDDDTTPSNADTNLFAVPDGDSSPEGALRRGFFASNGVYLMFNDTLRHEYIGKDTFGDDVYNTETIDFNYNLTDYSSEQYKFELLESLTEKEAAAAFVEEYIMPHFKGGSLCPYSFLLTKAIKRYDRYDKDFVDEDFCSCFRSTALSLGNISQTTDKEELKSMADDICISMLASKLPYSDERIKPFVNVSQDYYGEYLEDVVDGWLDYEHTSEEALETARQMGFLEVVEDWWSGTWYFPFNDDDYKAYFNLVMTTTPEEVSGQYGDYPLIVSKYMILRNVIISLGYKF